MPRLAALALLISSLSVMIAGRALGQSPDEASSTATGWRAPSGTGDDDQGESRYGAPAAQPLPAAPPPAERATRAQVSKGSGALPNDHGQVWREYDISPYTVRVEATQRPEQAIVDWILRETGYEAWHSTPVGLLSADRKVLRVYHTPQMQGVVADIVDRFVSSEGQNHGFGLRIVTLKNPNWRVRALPLMTSIPVQSPGVQGWIMAREDASLLLNELRKRTDYREHNTPHQMVLNGQTAVVSTMRPRSYAKGIILTQATWPGYQPEMGTIDEGFTLQFSPLLSTDAATTDAVVKLKLSQVEKMLAVQVEAPSAVSKNQHAQIEVPQLTQLELHERFRWPTNQVLLLSMGVAPTPGPETPGLKDVLPLPKNAPRADALLMIEHTGTVAQAVATPGAVSAPQTATRDDRTFHGRY
jgi:hypothetical protein